MKRQNLFLLVGLLVASIAFAFGKINFQPGKPTAANKGFALIELYTSEGCSSCPSADKLVAKIAQEYKDKEVYVLAYHVDYWNRLGWKDPFSSHQNSERQRQYSGYLKLDGVYTPQAIVNGQTEFVGSDERKTNATIKQNLAKDAPIDLVLTYLTFTKNKVSINYRVDNIVNNNLMLAVIKRHAETQVKAGENNGRTLPHINIVQRLEAINLKTDNGNADISLPAGFNIRDWAVIGFIQNVHSGVISAVKHVISDKETVQIIDDHNED